MLMNTSTIVTLPWPALTLNLILTLIESSMPQASHQFQSWSRDVHLPLWRSFNVVLLSPNVILTSSNVILKSSNVILKSSNAILKSLMSFWSHCIRFEENGHKIRSTSTILWMGRHLGDWPCSFLEVNSEGLMLTSAKTKRTRKSSRKPVQYNKCILWVLWTIDSFIYTI